MEVTFTIDVTQTIERTYEVTETIEAEEGEDIAILIAEKQQRIVADIRSGNLFLDDDNAVRHDVQQETTSECNDYC